MARTIIVSDETYAHLDALRQKLPDKNRNESFNLVIVRLLSESKKKVSL